MARSKKLSEFGMQHRKSSRLKGYDYSLAGAYFVTICTRGRECLFGEVANETMILSDIEKIAESCWNEIPHHFDHVGLDCFVVMPNHLHGILIIREDRRGTACRAPTNDDQTRHEGFRKPQKGSVPTVIRSFKAAVTRQCRLNRDDHFKWQRSYFDRIVRDEDELNRIREYITYNPRKWEIDKENSENRRS